jgi:hypothetical protein
MPHIRIKILCLLLLLSLSIRPSHAQGTVPTFTRAIAGSTYTLAGHDPASSGTTTIPTVLVPITLTFEGSKPAQMNATADVQSILKSPIFTRFAFAPGNKTQYADGLLRATFPSDTTGHTYLDKPEIKPLTIAIPPGYGYVLHSKKSGTTFAVVDVMFLEKQIFQQIPRQDGKLVIAVTHNTTYYTDNDATVCCSWGMHGVDGATGNSFVLGSYLRAAPAIVEDQDIQPLTQQLAEFFNDPLHDPETYFRTPTAAGNFFPAWLRTLDVSPHARHAAKPAGGMVESDGGRTRVKRACVCANHSLAKVGALQALVADIALDKFRHGPVEEQAASFCVIGQHFFQLLVRGRISDPCIAPIAIQVAVKHARGWAERISQTTNNIAHGAPALNILRRKAAHFLFATIVVIPKLNAAAVRREHRFPAAIPGMAASSDRISRSSPASATFFPSLTCRITTRRRCKAWMGKFISLTPSTITLP